MTDPIKSVDFNPINFPESSPSSNSVTAAPNRSSSPDRPVDSTVSEVRSPRSAREQAAVVQSRLQEAGANVRVGVESIKGNTVFTIRDAETGQVIRKIPSDEAIRISQNIDRLTGVYLDHLE